MSAQTENNNSRKKKIWTVVGVGALAAALAGGGALTTLFTSVDGNDFRSTVADSEEETQGSLLRLTGDPMDKEFDSSTHNDQVQAEWTLENLGPATTEFAASFEMLADIDQDLAEALVVKYGLVDADGVTVRWVDGGTVAQPLDFGTVTGLTAIDGYTQIPVHVQVILEDPSLISSDDPELIDTPLRVLADFVVSYLDPLGQPRA